MHARLRIGNGAIEMGDTQGTIGADANRVLSLRADADALYAQAVAPVRRRSPPSDQSYGDRMGSVMDDQGITWFIAQPA